MTQGREGAAVMMSLLQKTFLPYFCLPQYSDRRKHWQAVAGPGFF
ncbi:hypothetical protein SACS_0674 [Parasaccharibacter apium]|uniref:Uncharacterized protein n=1 Tax=Parasaccharibacter apium TaxID=1510841 RepID=A0A7U7J0U1_9PROT|nr:hypothetical protein SACS_0674 [Parasaccharibacter apium]